MAILCYIFSDNIWFWLLEVFILAVLILAMQYDIVACIKRTGEVTRGETSWGTILAFWTISIILIEIIISSDFINNYKIIVGLLNLGIFIYLFFFSSYFINKIVGWAGKLKKKKYPIY